MVGIFLLLRALESGNRKERDGRFLIRISLIPYVPISTQAIDPFARLVVSWRRGNIATCNMPEIGRRLYVRNPVLIVESVNPEPTKASSRQVAIIKRSS